MSNLNQHVKSDKVKWIVTGIALVLILAILGGVVAAVVTETNPKDWFEKPVEEQPETPDEETPLPDEDVSENETPAPSVDSTISNSEHIVLARSAAVTAAETNTVSVELTATVLPEDAPDKSVDWTVDWTVPVSEGAVLSDYVSVTPASDGSNVATVTFYQGFDGGSITVTATTRVGEFSATCLFLYEGAPERLGFEMNGVEYDSNDQIEVTAGQSYSVNLKLDNTLGQVGSKYGTFEIVEFRMQGRFNAIKKFIVNGSVSKSENVVIDLANPTFTCYGNTGGNDGITVTIDPSEFLDVSIDGDVLKITAKKNEASCKYPDIYPRTGTQLLYDSPYVDPRFPGGVPDNCRWIVFVRDIVSGKEAMLYVDIVSTVTSISMSETVVYI